MCGIAGIISFSGKHPDLAHLVSGMTQAIRHRGPDGEGFLLASANSVICAGGKDTPGDIFESRFPWSPSSHIDTLQENFNVALGHRRLSIIDLSPAGHQPMCDKEERYWLVYNGEIYNYLEVREELKKLGHNFISGTDTEVILNAYRQWGDECVLRFNGMWAFVIYDRKENKLFGSRDRFGVKPFYYYSDDHVFAFASEQKALVKQPFVTTGINDKAVVDFFVKSEIEYEEEGMFRNIIELFPSHSFTLDIATGKLTKWKYYTLPFSTVYERYNEEKLKEATENVRELLVNAVALRLRSDVTVGSCLSGGIDSSTIAGIINYLLGQDKNIHIGDRLKVFTASFNEQDIDESKWARHVADLTGADWKQTFPSSSDLLNDLRDLIYCQDVPIWSTSTYAQYRVMQLARQNGVTVVLDGQGGDELFAGYDPYYIPFWKEMAVNEGRNAALAEMKAYRPLSQSIRFTVKQTLKHRLLPQLSIGIQKKLQRSWFEEMQYLDRDLLNRHEESLSYTRQEDSSLNASLYNEFYNTRLKGYLKCEDRCSMWHSVESRTPFADDHRLIEYVFNLSPVYKIHNGINKFILRKAAAPFAPPQVLERRDKMGYVTPTRKWISEIRHELKPLFDETLKDHFDIKKLNRDFDKLFDQPQLPDNGRIFKFISFAVWKKVFFN